MLDSTNPSLNDSAALGEILIVDDTPANLHTLSKLLELRGYHIRVATSGQEGLADAQAAPPDLILLDIMMPKMDGYQVCRLLKADPRTRAIPVLFLSALGLTKDKVQGFEAGGADYITKPFQVAEVLARVQTHLERQRAETALRHANEQMQKQLTEIQALQSQLREQAIRDPLTGLFNRRYLEETIPREMARVARERTPLSLVMADIDHFKNFNDTFGHEAGDLVLQTAGSLLRQKTRQMDIVCRYGGEEFVVIMPGASLQIASQRAEQWREALESLCVEYNSNVLCVTASFGVATFPEHGATIEELARAADQAMYAAKTAGRNCVCTTP